MINQAKYIFVKNEFTNTISNSLTHSCQYSTRTNAWQAEVVQPLKNSDQHLSARVKCRFSVTILIQKPGKHNIAHLLNAKITLD